MQVKFLKDHLENKTGETKEVNEGLGNYLIIVGVCEKVDVKEKKQGSPVAKKKGK